MDINELFFIGSNRYGQAGTGEKTHNQTYQYPKPYCFPVFIQQISCGSHHSALLTIDGNVYTMGSNIHGTLGTSQSNLNYSFNPVFVQNLSDITKIVSGAFHIAAINSEGQLFMWGKGTDGQLGNSYFKNSFKPACLSVFHNQIEDVSCGLNHTLVLCKSKVYAFGNGIFGQLGIGSNRNFNIPTKVSIFDDLKVDAISAGDNHSLFLVNGEVYACGDNSFGQLGVQLQKKYVLEPAKIPNLCNVSVIQAAKFSAVLTLDGKLFIWGGKFRQIQPSQITEKLDNFVDIRAGGDRLYGLTFKGDLYLFDLNCDNFSDIKISKIPIQENSLCQNSTILDFDLGQNHSLILGGIVGQLDTKFSINNRFLKVVIEDKSQVSKNIISSSNYESCEIGRSMMARKKYFSNVKQEINQQSLENQYNQLLHKNGIKTYISNTSEQVSLQPSLPKRQLKMHHINSLDMQKHNQNFESSQSQLQNQISLQQLANAPASIIKSASNLTKKQNKNEDPIMSRFMLFENKSKSKNNSICSSQSRNEKCKQQIIEAKLDKILQLLSQSSQLNKQQMKDINQRIKYDLSNKQNVSHGEAKDFHKVKGNKQLIMNLREKQLRISEMQQLLSRKQLQLQAQRQTISVLKIMIEQKTSSSQLI